MSRDLLHAFTRYYFADEPIALVDFYVAGLAAAVIGEESWTSDGALNLRSSKFFPYPLLIAIG